MTNKEIAELTTKIVVSAANNPSHAWKGNDFCSFYEIVYDVIKKKDREHLTSN